MARLNADDIINLVASIAVPDRNWVYIVYALLVLELWLRGRVAGGLYYTNMN